MMIIAFTTTKKSKTEWMIKPNDNKSDDKNKAQNKIIKDN